jgi:hypothetical protein
MHRGLVRCLRAEVGLMFTTGSKFYIGIATLSAIASIVFLLTNDQVALGCVALLTLMVSSGIVAGASLASRDGDAADAASAPAADRAPGASMWPLVLALGVVVVAIGMITKPLVFVIGIAVVLAALAEWLVQSWSERASADRQFNALARKRLLNPLEFPVLAALVVGVVAFSFSRIMLAASREGSAIIFIAIATLVLLVMSLFAVKPSMKTGTIAAIAAVSVLGLVAAGITTFGIGEREELTLASQEDHYSHRECGEERSEHFDKGAERTVSAKSSVIATVILKDGELTAKVLGIGEGQKIVTVPRSNPTSILFQNLDAGEHRLTAYLGKTQVSEGVTEDILNCTQMVGEGGKQILTLRITKPTNAEDPYTLSVPGVEGSSVEMFVP